jgi:WD40 repeat protein
VAELPVGGDTLAFSSDGGLLALGSSQHELEVWSTDTWQRVWAASHDDGIRRIAFSPDDRYLASASFDHTARLWDAVAGGEISRLEFGYWVYGLDFSSDGQLWAAGSFDGKAVIAHTSSGRIMGEFDHELKITSLALSPDGPWMAVMTTGSWGPGKVLVWDIHTHESRLLAEFRGPAYSNVVFSPDTSLLAAGLGAGGPVALWHTRIWTEAAQLMAPQGTVNRLAFSPDGRHLAAAVSTPGETGLVVVWDLETARRIAEMEQPDVLWDMVFSPDGRFVVTGLGQGIEHPPAYEALLWEVASGTVVARMPHQRQVLAVAFSQDGNRIASGSNDAVKIWELRAGD